MNFGINIYLVLMHTTLVFISHQLTQFTSLVFDVAKGYLYIRMDCMEIRSWALGERGD